MTLIKQFGQLRKLLYIVTPGMIRSFLSGGGGGQLSGSQLTWRGTTAVGGHPRPQVADKGTPPSMDKRVAPDKEGAVDKQCLWEGKLLFRTGADGARLAFLGKSI